tara:strand:- start:360 stop:851 length:492 start_codon:yes stop_codon:yes gene_type:complete
MDINAEISDMKVALASLEAKAQEQEPTLTPVSFESRGELAKALVDGRTFKTPYTGATLMYIDSWGWGSPFRLMRDGKDRGPMNGVWSQYDNLQEINAAPAEPWYLNIPPEGIECYVSDVDPNPCLGRNPVVLVTKYDLILLCPFQCPQNHWKYATPVNERKIT